MKMDKTTIRLFVIILLVIAGIIVTYSINKDTTEKIDRGFYTFTKAICNETNFCQDYVIECNNEVLINMTPTEATAQFPTSWEDPRDNETKNKLCEE